MPALGLFDQGAGQDAHAGRHHVYEEGEAFYWAPGHAPEALEDSDYVDFSPTRELDEVIDHITSQGS